MSWSAQSSSPAVHNVRGRALPGPAATGRTRSHSDALRSGGLFEAGPAAGPEAVAVRFDGFWIYIYI